MKKFGPNMDIVVIVARIALIVGITSLFCITSDIHCYMQHLPVAAMADRYGWMTVLRRSDTSSGCGNG